MMRQLVYIRELLHVFGQHTELNDENRLALSDVIFGVRWNPEASAYALRSEIRSATDLEAALGSLAWVSTTLRSDLTNLFAFSNEDLVLYPELLGHLRDFGKVAIFCGAGASMVMGIPSWGGLAESAISWLSKKRRFSNLECEYLRKEFRDPKQLLTIFHDYVPLDSDEGRQFYTESLRQTEEGQKNLKSNLNIYGHLASLECLKVTTNIEDEFGRKVQHFYSNKGEAGASGSQILKIDRICVPSGMADLSQLKTDAIYHLHGTLENLGSAVLTTKKYVEAYYNVAPSGKSDAKSYVFQFLEVLFRDYTVVFIGSSLSEFVILEQLLRSQILSKHGTRRHYALVPSKQFEAAEFRLQLNYFNHLGIQAIPYFTDQNGHDRLYDVVAAWSEQVIKSRGTHVYENLELIREGL